MRSIRIGLFVLVVASLSACKSTQNAGESSKGKSDGCGNSAEMVEIRFSREADGANPFLLPTGEHFITPEKHYVVVGNMAANPGWNFVDLNNDGLSDLVIGDPGSVGTSLEEKRDFYVQCSQGKYKRVLSVDSQSAEAIPSAADWNDIVVGWRSQTGPVSFEFNYKVYSGQGGVYSKTAHEVLVNENDFALLSLGTAQDVNEAHASLPDNYSQFKKHIESESDHKIVIKTASGSPYVIETVPQSEVAEMRSHAKFVHFFKDKDLVLYAREHWEANDFLLLNIQTGTAASISSIPFFSPSGEQFATIYGDFERPDIPSHVSIYNTKDIEHAIKKMDMEPRSFKQLTWERANCLTGLGYHLSEEGMETAEKIRIVLKRK